MIRRTESLQEKQTKSNESFSKYFTTYDIFQLTALFSISSVTQTYSFNLYSTLKTNKHPTSCKVQRNTCRSNHNQASIFPTHSSKVPTCFHTKGTVLAGATAGIFTRGTLTSVVSWSSKVELKSVLMLSVWTEPASGGPRFGTSSSWAPPSRKGMTGTSRTWLTASSNLAELMESRLSLSDLLRRDRTRWSILSPVEGHGAHALRFLVTSGRGVGPTIAAATSPATSRSSWRKLCERRSGFVDVIGVSDA